MASRMERYYKPNTSLNKRSQKNEQLYRNIYANAEYSNIESIANIDKNNEIDINKVKDMIVNRESYLQGKEFRKAVREEPVIHKQEQYEEKNYDIRDILNRAKSSREVENDHRALSNTSYDIFKELREKRRKEIEAYGETEEGLKELIDTINKTSSLNQTGDKDLSLDLLDDLKSSGNTAVMPHNESIKAILEEARKQEAKKEYTNTSADLDKSFFTNSMKFKNEDFDQLSYINKNLKKNNLLIKILLLIIFIGIASGIIILVFNLLK